MVEPPFMTASSKMVVMVLTSSWFDSCSNPGGQCRRSTPVAVSLAVTWSTRALCQHSDKDKRRASTVAFRLLATRSRVHVVLYDVARPAKPDIPRCETFGIDWCIRPCEKGSINTLV